MTSAFPFAPIAPRPVILLVDDTPANLDLLRAMLSPYYDLKIANRGAKALAICASGEPIDLISYGFHQLCEPYNFEGTPVLLS